MSVGTAMFWLPMMIPMGTLMALPPSVSQLDGANRRGEIAPLFRQSLWLAAALGAEGRARAEREFGWDVVADRIDAVYTTLTAPSGSDRADLPRASVEGD